MGGGAGKRTIRTIMSTINPIIEGCPSVSPMEVPQYVLDVRKKIIQDVAIRVVERIEKKKPLKKPHKKSASPAKAVKSVKGVSKSSPRMRRVVHKPFKGIVNGFHCNDHPKADTAPGWHQGNGKNILVMEQIMHFAEVSLKNLINLAKLEVEKEQLGNVRNVTNVTVLYNLIELKKKEMGIIYNYIKRR